MEKENRLELTAKEIQEIAKQNEVQSYFSTIKDCQEKEKKPLNYQEGSHYWVG